MAKKNEGGLSLVSLFLRLWKLYDLGPWIVKPEDCFRLRFYASLIGTRTHRITMSKRKTQKKAPCSFLYMPRSKSFANPRKTARHAIFGSKPLKPCSEKGRKKQKSCSLANSPGMTKICKEGRSLAPPGGCST
jgi:hypothetical protein